MDAHSSSDLLSHSFETQRLGRVSNERERGSEDRDVSSHPLVFTLLTQHSSLSYGGWFNKVKAGGWRIKDLEAHKISNQRTVSLFEILCVTRLTDWRHEM